MSEQHPGKVELDRLLSWVAKFGASSVSWHKTDAIASYVSDLEARLETAEAKLRGIFASDGNEEARWIEDMKHACPHCGGSGHKDDVRALKDKS